MSKAKFAAAKELIQEKEYAAARAVLQTIDDPQAVKWLAQLDQMNAATPRRSTILPWVIAGLAIVVAIASVIFALTSGGAGNPLTQNATRADVQRMFDAYCAYPFHDTILPSVTPARLST